LANLPSLPNSKDLEESRLHLQHFQDSPHTHWYFGLFHLSGTLLGEGGLLNLGGSSVSGWPELDFIILPSHQRRGLGTQLFDSVVSTWWALPRERRRFQLHPWGVVGIEPGSPLVDCVAMYWDKSNEAAEGFFGSVLDKRGVDVNMTGTFEDFDKREGSETGGQVREWRGTAVPNPVPFVDEVESD
jgi:GNAT superfamily N-acetyltransferase